MTHVPSDVAFTAAVKAVQQQLGSRAMYARMEREGGWQTEVTDELADFIAGLDTFFLGTASAAGQPYIQHRGGPAGFLKVLDAHTLAFADFSGNRQYITAGNLSENPRAILFLIDYEAQRRIKVWGTAAVVADDPALLARLHDPSYRGRPERALLFTVQAWDVNCPQHIQPRVLASDVAPLLESLRARVVELEAEVARPRGQ